MIVILVAVRGPAGAGFNVEEHLSKVREAQRSSSVLEIGDLLRVRGSLKTSREQREIMASLFCKPPAKTHLSHVHCRLALGSLVLHDKFSIKTVLRTNVRFSKNLFPDPQHHTIKTVKWLTEHHTEYQLR